MLIGILGCWGISRIQVTPSPIHNSDHFNSLPVLLLLIPALVGVEDERGVRVLSKWNAFVWACFGLCQRRCDARLAGQLNTFSHSGQRYSMWTIIEHLKLNQQITSNELIPFLRALQTAWIKLIWKWQICMLQTQTVFFWLGHTIFFSCRFQHTARRLHGQSTRSVLKSTGEKNCMPTTRTTTEYLKEKWKESGPKKMPQISHWLHR